MLQSQIVIPKLNFIEEPQNSIYIILPKNNQLNDQSKYYQTLEKYCQKLQQFQKHIQKGIIVKAFGFDPEDAFQEANVLSLNDPLKLGTKLARSIEQNSTIILPSDFTLQDLNYFLFGFKLANYKFHMKTTIPYHIPIKELNLIHPTITQEKYNQFVQDEWKNKILSVLPSNILRLRQLVSLRANIATTTYLVQKVKEVKEVLGDKVNLELIEGEELLKKRLNLIHAVGRASQHQPALAILSYKGREDCDEYYCLVGKGIVFDSGGLTIKSLANMNTMYDDKTGACVVLESFRALVELAIPANIVCALAIAENSINGDSYRPSDIIQSYKGLTVEVLNCDAEGRLVLADAMSYTQDHYKVKLMIDVATLTGSIRPAIGGEQAGLFCNDKKLIKQMKKVSKLTAEKFYELPFGDEFKNQMKGTHADINNAGGRTGASCAAEFLRFFVEKNVKWMHWDMGNLALTSKDEFIYTPGATGFGLQQIVYLIAALENLLGEDFLGKEKKQIEQKEQQVEGEQKQETENKE